MKYQLKHLTRYEYSGPATLSHNEARILPRQLPWQTSSNTQLIINPGGLGFSERQDFFGNRVTYFAIEAVHNSLEVVVSSEVETFPRPAQDFFSGTAWEDAAAEMSCAVRSGNRDSIAARLFVLDSPFIARQSALMEYARVNFASGRLLRDALLELNKRIFDEFTYDEDSTTLATPLQEVLETKRGVCQDFAHLLIGCLRSIGLAARYVSGYMETSPPPGQEKLLGADATHAWVAVFIPGWGWQEVDPTNGCVPDERYIILGWGRDFADVTPLKGVMTGGGEHKLTVAVDVIPIVDVANERSLF
ncbi:transglutaminase family protein [Pseudohongiella sp.]|uniref:Transglutaminase-like domain-containing protein n=1 Tax=marine sediment metagenome TaxID=412755 RepID=A0A0F9W8Q7_9ZZZZ|nr:transglutaminase family protein [Pseudohongiella sp.]HDZ08160.1 transglutaminase family protein [Pseudohongiella sp.]HEA63128.1 transglutaminase family protein [Pseudohongiella sp.]